MKTEPVPMRAGEIPGGRLLGAARFVGIESTPRMDGIDISQYQGAVNHAAIQATGMQWIGMRVTHAYTDTQFARNRAGFAWARWRLLYDFADPGGDAGPFLRAVGPFQRGEAAMLDAEAAGLTEDDCVRWLAQVEAVTGRPSVVYTGKYTAGGTIWSSPRVFNGQRARILAAYTDEARARSLAAPYGWDAWQWSSKGSVPGIGGNVDLDQVDNPIAFDRACGLTDQQPPPPLPTEEQDMAFIARNTAGSIFLVAADCSSKKYIGGADTWNLVSQGGYKQVELQQDTLANIPMIDTLQGMAVLGLQKQDVIISKLDAVLAAVLNQQPGGVTLTDAQLAKIGAGINLDFPTAAETAEASLKALKDELND